MIDILSTIIPLVLALLAMAAVIYLSYIFSKYVAAGAGRMNGAKYMRIVDRMVLGQDKMMMIVQIGDGYYLTGVTAQNVQLIKELSGEDLIELEAVTPSMPMQQVTSFKSALQKHMTKDKRQE